MVDDWVLKRSDKIWPLSFTEEGRAPQDWRQYVSLKKLLERNWGAISSMRKRIGLVGGDWTKMPPVELPLPPASAGSRPAGLSVKSKDITVPPQGDFAAP